MKREEINLHARSDINIIILVRDLLEKLNLKLIEVTDEYNLVICYEFEDVDKRNTEGD